MQIPKPKLGDWARFAHGKRFKKPPLPRVEGIRSEVIIKPKIKKAEIMNLPPELASKVQAEKSPSKLINVSESLQGCHSLVRITRQVLEKRQSETWGIDTYGMISTPRNEKCLDLRISKPSLLRGLRIMNALIKALEERGMSVQIGEGGRTSVKVHEETVSIKIYETAKKDKTQYAKFFPTGKLLLIVGSHWYGSPESPWRDRSGCPLENQLNDVIGGILIQGEHNRKARIIREENERRWAEERRIREEEERRRRIEESRRQKLEDRSIAWAKCQQLRTFIEACEQEMKRSGSLSPSGPENAWLQWARHHAERFNSVVETVSEIRSGLSTAEASDDETAG